MNGKQFTIAILFAVVLLTLVFAPLAHQQGGGTYDPWLDYNEDGRIDVDELYRLGETYGSTGNPTKNVTIVGHASKVIQAALGASVPPTTGYWSSGTISVKNYSKVTVLIYLSESQNSYSLFAEDRFMQTSWRVEIINNFGNHLVKTYDVMNEAISILVVNESGNSASINVDIYLMA